VTAMLLRHRPPDAPLTTRFRCAAQVLGFAICFANATARRFLAEDGTEERATSAELLSRCLTTVMCQTDMHQGLATATQLQVSSGCATPIRAASIIF